MDLTRFSVDPVRARRTIHRPDLQKGGAVGDSRVQSTYLMDAAKRRFVRQAQTRGGSFAQSKAR